MSRRPAWLILTLLALLILTVGVMLHWGAEAAFFATWLFLALVVQHDSRLSAAAGLIFLATCPILLIAKREPAAEQAANYAYFFLAIGVLVQLEDLFLERRGWLGRKLSLDPLWQPVERAAHRCWAAAVAVVGRVGAAADRPLLVRLVQILGSLGLAAVFVWAAVRGPRLGMVLPLLGGALLFPFLVWAVHAALRALGAARVLRGLLILAALSLAAAEMIWLQRLAAEARLARLAPTHDLVSLLPEAQRTSPTPDGEAIETQVWSLDELSRRVLYQHPAFAGASRLAYRLPIARGTVLAFDLATAPESWELPGDGVTFSVYVDSRRGLEQLFSTYLDPKRVISDRHWHPHTVHLGAYAGQTVTLILETGTGPAGDARYDWAGWGAPRLLAPQAGSRP